MEPLIVFDIFKYVILHNMYLVMICQHFMKLSCDIIMKINFQNLEMQISIERKELFEKI